MNSEDPRTEPLKEWNRLARENTENAMVSSMLDAGLGASAPLDTFSTWLLVSAAAVASFLITNADKVLPFISQRGFLVCGAFLCTSCIFGLLSKVFALRCRISIESIETVKRTFVEHLSKYAEEEKKIREGAEFWGIDLQTGIRLDRVLSQFYALLPKWVSWFASRQLKKNEGNPQVSYLIPVRSLNRQGFFALLQSLCFLSFLIAGFGFSA